MVQYLNSSRRERCLLENNQIEKICTCNYRILIVDDNDFNILILKQMIGDVKINFHILYLVINNFQYQNGGSYPSQLNNKCITFDVDMACDGNFAI